MKIAMPTKPKRSCAYISCPNRVPAGQTFCRQHQKEQVRRYDKKRGSSYDRGYNVRWRRARRMYLNHHPFCYECGGLATVVDHIIPHKGDQDLFWDESNWGSMCTACHGKKTATEDGGFGNKPKRQELTHAGSR